MRRSAEIPRLGKNEVIHMAYSLRCADSGMDCPAEFKTATQSELMEVIKVHAPISHPDLELNAETVAMVTGLVREVP
jgi:predicted small metal-binding protein